MSTPTPPIQTGQPEPGNPPPVTQPSIFVPGAPVADDTAPQPWISTQSHGFPAVPAQPPRNRRVLWFALAAVAVLVLAVGGVGAWLLTSSSTVRQAAGIESPFEV